jgi:dipeptidyl aminopeptidase/acylaminoacyl peptidase
MPQRAAATESAFMERGDYRFAADWLVAVHGLTRVGVWGHSAGGYDSTHAILTHPEFYKVAVSSAGCHDNRMDKAT